MIKRFLIAILLLGLVAGGLVGFNLFRDKAIASFFAGMKPPTVTISATEVRPTTWKPGIEAIGTAKAAQGVDVAVETGGVIKSVTFKPNTRVNAGQLLVQIEDAVERADLIAARAAVERDRTQFERAQALTRTGAGSQQALDQARAALDASRSALERIQATLELKAIVAPFAGTVGIPRVDVGEYVQPGQPIATLQDLDTVRVDFTVPEQQVALLSIGQTVQFAAETGGESYSGHIIGIEPKTDPATRLVPVRAEVDNRAGAFRPGQFVRARVDLTPQEGIIALPQTAVVTSLYGDYVYVVVDDQPAEGEKRQVVRQVFVKAGRRNGQLIEIVEGVAAGAQVVTAGQNKLDNGTPVRIDNSIDPAQLAQAGK